MKSPFGRFNIYLLLVLVGAVGFGCHSAEAKRRRQLSTLQLHAEMQPDAMGRSERIEIYREKPVPLTVDKAPFLSEGSVKEAKVVDVPGGFALSIQFDRQGSWLLEQYSAALRGRHIAIFSQFVTPPDEKLNEGRWLAAPRVTAYITDGQLVFTPDATRDEADQIVLGLNNLARKFKDEPGR